jgi:crossover junction endodeoxyribonuclease RusA
MTVIELPFPPSTNNLFVNGLRGRFPSQRYADWITEAGWILTSQRPPKVAGPVVLSFWFNPPDKRKRDITNLLKAPEDLLVKHGVIEADDNTIVRAVHAGWSTSVKGVKIEIESV